LSSYTDEGTDWQLCCWCHVIRLKLSTARSRNRMT
jgi:hypothetical protein